MIRENKVKGFLSDYAHVLNEEERAIKSANETLYNFLTNQIKRAGISNEIYKEILESEYISSALKDYVIVHCYNKLVPLSDEETNSLKIFIDSVEITGQNFKEIISVFDEVHKYLIRMTKEEIKEALCLLDEMERDPIYRRILNLPLFSPINEF